MNYCARLLLIIVSLSAYLPSCFAIGLDRTKLFIKSDALTLNSQEQTAIFTGNVIVNFQDMTLTTAKLVVYYTEQNNKKTIDRFFFPAALQVIKSHDGEIIVADSANYIVNLRQLTLTGNVRMLKKNKLLVTEKLVYFTKIKILK